MENYFKSLDKKACNGCGVCALKCPKNAITMEKDSEGFLYPVINKEKCISCGLCEKICSNFPEYNNFDIKAYAAKNKNDEERKDSTSGGMFKILAKYVISKKGVVFGVKYDEDLNVVHDYAETLDGCKKFSISKYVRSDLNNSYNKVKEFLDDGKYVLFTGTPCQCYGLRKFLIKEYENLIICEIICHSNPSPKVYKMYIKNREKQYSKKIKCMYFRSKNQSVENKSYLEFEDGSIKKDTAFNTAFNSMLFSRPSCAACNFCDINRKADITIGDFWGIENIKPEFKDGKGVSLLTINTEKGSKIFEDIKIDMEYIEEPLELSFKANHHSNIPESKHREEFFKLIENKEINNDNICKYIEKYTQDSIFKRILRKGKRIVKKIIKRK